MPRAQIINQNPSPDVLPNFRSMGVTLRIVLLVNGMALLLAVAQATSWQDIIQRLIDISTLLQPVLFSSLLLLYAGNSVLAQISYRKGMVAILFAVAAVTLAIYQLGGDLYALSIPDHSHFSPLRYTMLGVASAALVLAYFRLRAHALSPALHDARLQALQARIRPHFLFNSINAVLGIVRADPKRAETALEDMADLFRMAMAHTSDLVAVREEVALARQYLELEQLRLGERLKVNWHTEDMPDDALLPPLMLQPLLENAVYHGIEPLTEGGTIDIRLYLQGKEMHLEMYNPRQVQGNHHTGNRMALDNIRERLSMQFDLEARYTVETGKDFYRVHIMLPYVRE
jgi:two-component system, LytTR family, sensor histidine kinase AlgZ